ncbi:hypothetical protein ACU8KH_00650 [Lachancea thermotolerans]
MSLSKTNNTGQDAVALAPYYTKPVESSRPDLAAIYTPASQADDDEDLIVDLSTGSLQTTTLRSWRLMARVQQQLERL